MNNQVFGRIMKGIGGFYYVFDGESLYECKAKGAFRKQNQKPLVGDRVRINVVSDDKKTGNIEEILKRENCLIRPEIANVDQIILYFAIREPNPNFDMLNRYLCQIAGSEIPTVIVGNKLDLSSKEDQKLIEDYFTESGFQVLFISAKTGENLEALREILRGKTTAVSGPSGAGKSSLLNALLDKEIAETGVLSNKIRRGKNTTRHSEIFSIEKDTYLFDTPGFTSVDISNIKKEDLAYAFPEFIPYIPKCKFASCTHVKEKECGIKMGVSEHRISALRYESYVRFYEELSKIRRY